MAHPAADFAKEVMQVAVAGTGVHLADGSTNVLPVGSAAEVHAAWRLHHDLVRRCLERAYYQGWDMHPGHLPTRYIANFAFYREGFDTGGGAIVGVRTPERDRHPRRTGHGEGPGPLPVPRNVCGAVDPR